MSAIITSILSSTLKVFIKDYNKQQLNFKLFGGEITFDSFQINEQVIHEILHIPSTLEIKAIKCESLKIKVPWTNLKHEPITMNLSGIDIDIKECFEPVQQKSGNHSGKFLRSHKSKKGSKSSASSSDKTKSAQEEKDIGFVKKLFEDISINVKDLRGHISFLSSDRLSDGPEVSFNLAMLVLRSTNSEWKVVDLAKMRVIPKGSPNYVLYKEVLLGSIVFSTKDPYHDYTDFIKTQPITIRNVIKHPMRKLKPVDIATTIEVKKCDITLNKNCVSSVVSSINSLLWSFQNGKADPSREGQPQTDKAADADSDSDDSDDEDLENLIKDKLYGQKSLGESGRKSSDFPEIDEGMLGANDEYINSLEEEFDKLENEAKDLSPSSHSSSQQSPNSPAAGQGGSIIPLIKVGFICENLCVSVKEVANVDLKQINLKLAVEPEPQVTVQGKPKMLGGGSSEGGSSVAAGGAGGAGAGSGSVTSGISSSLDSVLQNPDDFLAVMQRQSKDDKKSKKIMSALKMSVFSVDLSLGSFSVVSAIPKKGKYRGYTKNRVPNIRVPSVEVCSNINHFELVLEPLFLDSVVKFLGTGFSLRKLNKKKSSSAKNASSDTNSDSSNNAVSNNNGGGSGSGNGNSGGSSSGKSGWSDKLWFISNARVNVCYNGITISFGEIDKIVNEAFIVHVEKVMLVGVPSTEIASSFTSNGIDLANKVFDEDASLNEFNNEVSSQSSSQSSNTVATSLDPPSSSPVTTSLDPPSASSSSSASNANYGFNLLALNILFSNVWFGVTKVDDIVKFVEPFEIDSEVHVFQPIPLICSLLKKTTINDLQKEQEMISEEQLPAISFDLNLSPLIVKSLQSCVYYSYKYVLPLLKFPKKILSAIKLSTKPTQVKANLPGRSISSTSLRPPKEGPVSSSVNVSATQQKPKLKKMAKVKKKADMIKRAMEMRLAKSALPFRIFAAGGIEKIQISMECGEETIEFILDNVMLLGKKKKEDKTAIKRFIEEVLDRSLHDELDAPKGSGKVPVTMDFLSTELSFNYNPPMPMKITDILMLSDSSGLKSLSEKDVTTVEANVNLKDFNISLHPSQKFPIGLSLCPQSQKTQQENDSSPATTSRESENAVENAGDKLTPTDIIFIKYRLEYGDRKVNRNKTSSDERRPKHYLFFTVSGIKVVSDGSTNTIIDLIKRISHPVGFTPRVSERNFGDDVTVDIKFCDIDFVHEDTVSAAKMKQSNNENSPFLASIKFLPKSDAGILYLQDRFTYKVTQLRVKHENELEKLQKALEGAKKEIKDLEELLIGAKVSCATMAVNLEESNNALIKAKREGVLKDAKITQLIAEKVALGSTIKTAAAGSGNLASNTDIQNLIKELNDKNIDLSSECERLRVELSAQKVNLLKLNDDKNAHIERLQKAAAEREKTLIEENERLKKLLSERDAQLEAAQKSLLDRQIIAEKLAKAEKQIANQQRAVEFSLKKTASRKICPATSSTSLLSSIGAAAVLMSTSSSITLSSPPSSSSSSSSAAISVSSPFDDPVGSSPAASPASQSSAALSSTPTKSQLLRDESSLDQSSGSSKGISGTSSSDAKLEKKHRRFIRGKSLANLQPLRAPMDDMDETMTEVGSSESKHRKKKSKKGEQDDGEEDASAEKKSSHDSLKVKSSKRRISASETTDGSLGSAISIGPTTVATTSKDSESNADELMSTDDDGSKKKKRGYGKFKTSIDTKKSKKKKDKTEDDE